MTAGTGPRHHREPVTTLQRPPVRRSTLVRSDRAHTFEVFVATIGAWWPVLPYSAGRERVRDVVVEARPGGRVHETWDDGTTVVWGELLVWDPPHRFVMTWTATPAPTEVELTFAALGPALTRVEVCHRGWEALSEAQLTEDCAQPGGYTSGAYGRGWSHILGCFTTAAEACGDRTTSAPTAREASCPRSSSSPTP
ncbi:SRPBCC domain-containing protein [Pseudonocardia sp. C8]|uniref:SRPBCC domain-containing protein n=1 Tax=Pseudonocardia sp. C8 TaxID=2762759 RepID=UPI00164368B9|nr:SRPBCC domain-containing protein [Pseudonocardia sp. C8]MBC3189845.1 SRPBCC domain-containing protein [Pseudonocardia sp. C8]